MVPALSLRSGFVFLYFVVLVGVEKEQEGMGNTLFVYVFIAEKTYTRDLLVQE